MQDSGTEFVLSWMTSLEVGKDKGCRFVSG